MCAANVLVMVTSGCFHLSVSLYSCLTFLWSLVGLFLQESMQCAICVCLDPMRNDEDKCRISYYFMISPIGDPDPGDGLSAYNQ